MALRDYVLCYVCEKKLMPDGADVLRDWLEDHYGVPNCDEWTVKPYCPDCSDDGSMKFVPPRKEGKVIF